MIKKVKKINNTNDEGQIYLGTYKITTINDEILYIPLNASNRHYQEILEWEKIDGNTIEEAD